MSSCETICVFCVRCFAVVVWSPAAMALGVLLFVLLLVSVSAALPTPNIVFILADDLGYGELSIMPRGPSNNTNISTPNIDGLFTSGLQFGNAYCGEAVCAPSRASLFTGRHTGHVSIRGNDAGPDGHGLPLLPNETTVFQVAKAAGYKTACIGKWGVGNFNTTGGPDVKGASWRACLAIGTASPPPPHTHTHTCALRVRHLLWGHRPILCTQYVPKRA